MFHSTSSRKPTNRGLVATVDNIRFARKTKQTKGYEPADYIEISLPNKIAQEARIIKGDRIDILVDEANKRVCIARCNDGGWTLGQYAGATFLKTSYSEFKGCVSVSKEKKHSIIQKYKVTDTGIEFDMPDSLVIK
tara:strand:+ start:247 stop:654 length:408 start_codon:yes stop_codon:yes gene_type:complete